MLITYDEYSSFFFSIHKKKFLFEGSSFQPDNRENNEKKVKFEDVKLNQNKKERSKKGWSLWINL